jgi:hypothetical protein
MNQRFHQHCMADRTSFNRLGGACLLQIGKLELEDAEKGGTQQLLIRGLLEEEDKTNETRQELILRRNIR